MPLEILSGGTTTFAAGTDINADGANIGGQLNLGGGLNTDASFSAAGSATATGTASATPAAVVVAAGVGEASGVALAVETFLSGVSYQQRGLDVDTQHNLGGELNVEDPAFRVASGNGEATGTASATSKTANTAIGSGTTAGTASATPAAIVVAAGTGEGSGISAFPAMFQRVAAVGAGDGIGSASATPKTGNSAAGAGEAFGSASKQTFILYPIGTTTFATGLDLKTQRNLGGELNIDGAITLGGDGVGDSVGSADVFRSLLAINAAGTGEGIGDTPFPEITQRVAASGIGELRPEASVVVIYKFSGNGVGEGSGDSSIFIIYTFSGVGEGEGLGSADDTTIQAVDADGIGDGIGTGSLTQFLDTVRASGVGELNADASIAVFVNFPTGDGVGTASGDASRQLVDKISGIGTGESVGEAELFKIVPLVRGDTLGIDYDDDESVGLNAEQD